MLRKEKQGVVWFEFELLQKHQNVRHAVFAQNNVDLSIPENRQKAFQAIDMPDFVHTIYGHQVHGDYIHEAKFTPENERWIAACDGFVTSELYTALAVRHADCQAALFYDSKLDCIAAVHSGWRGSTKNIYKQAIEHMQSLFGSQPENILVCISPSLGPDAAEFINYKQELPKEFWQFQSKPLYFDFWKISRWQLESTGILPGHIEIASLCTFHNPDQFYSYRRNRTQERHLTTIWLDLLK